MERLSMAGVTPDPFDPVWTADDQRTNEALKGRMSMIRLLGEMAHPASLDDAERSAPSSCAASRR